MRVTHKFGKDYGIEPITGLKNHISNNEIDKVLYEINDMLYFFKNLYINSAARSYILSELTAKAKRLKEIELKPEAPQHKLIEELLEKLRTLYRNTEQIPDKDDEYFNKLVNNMGKFRLAFYLKTKESGKLTKELTIKYLYDNVLFCKIYGINESIISIQKELLNNFEIK